LNAITAAMPSSSAFAQRYGPWALVTGAAQGLGEAFARALAARGLNLVLVDLQDAPLKALAQDLNQNGVEALPLVSDLAKANAAPRIVEALGDRPIGLLVANAAFSRVAPFMEQSVENHERHIDINIRSTMQLLHALAPAMLQHRRGGVILLSSASAGQGSPLLASYAASKAWLQVFAESLHMEWKPQGVDVLALLSGAMPDRVKGMGVMPVEPVVEEGLRALGKHPYWIAGRANRWSSVLLHRLFGRRFAMRVYSNAVRRLYGVED
jgi:short-subunit dehydrogenase